ncbi:O-antigen ligase family protein [Consotaella aegiceratis]|uniref:O-antigen ligase family protein n=1 Tax=Consotaella aegiceratis TaxID=3097961 RepID=UPI002F4026F8
MTFRRWLFWRRRFDTSLLALTFALLAMAELLGKGLLVLFAGIGIYLFFGWHRVRRLASPPFTVAVVVYFVWSTGLSIVRGEPLTDNRQIAYDAIILVSIFLPLGICLVPHPAKAMALGARVGVGAVFILTFTMPLSESGRVGLGINEAVFGFLAAAIGVISRLPAGRLPAGLATGPAFFYIAAVPAILSGTRAVWPIIILIAAFDAIAALRHMVRAGRARLAAIAATVALAAIALSPLPGFVAGRVMEAHAQLDSFMQGRELRSSIGVRGAMWQGGLAVIAEHPVIGVGPTKRVEAAAEAASMGSEFIREYLHLHNLILDTALSSGVVGLILLLAIFGAFLWEVFRGPADRQLKETSVAMVFLVFLFGSFHGIFLNEWSLCIIFGFLTVVLTDLRRRTLLTEARSRLLSATPGG